MKRRTMIRQLSMAVPAMYMGSMLQPDWMISYPGPGEPMAKGPFAPDWKSLQQYQVPDWFRDAKFGIWAHWGVQCQPEFGDWYARSMYIQGSRVYKYHVEKYGHPSKFGFKNVINEWKADKWDPEELVALYKNAGAAYFMAMANHHDNFDNYDSKYHRWNSVKLGPKKDLIAGWEKAARRNGLRFGVSVHAAHAPIFYEQSRNADKTGPFAGVPYDGLMTKRQGKGSWWENYDPQDLYEQRGERSVGSEQENHIHNQWGWENGATKLSKAYCEKFYNRTVDLINKYDPDLVYFDDTALPLWPVSDAGLRIAAHYYNRSISKRGKLDVVATGKILTEEQRKCMVWDIEKGQSNNIEPLPWQTDTCIGSWHYDRPRYDNKKYKSVKSVVHALVDVVSKNGNLMLNIPVRGDGSIDDQERKIVEEITAWMKVNSEAIYSTRPWTIFGEGPAIKDVAPLSAQGFNEGKGKPFTAEDVRFTTKGNVLYAFLMGWPGENEARIESLGYISKHIDGKKVGKVSMLGYKGELVWQQLADYLGVKMPLTAPCDHAVVLKIEGLL